MVLNMEGCIMKHRYRLHYFELPNQRISIDFVVVRIELLVPCRKLIMKGIRLIPAVSAHRSDDQKQAKQKKKNTHVWIYDIEHANVYTIQSREGRKRCPVSMVLSGPQWISRGSWRSQDPKQLVGMTISFYRLYAQVTT